MPNIIGKKKTYMSIEFPKQEPVPVEDREAKLARLRAELAAFENEESKAITSPTDNESISTETDTPDLHTDERVPADASALAKVREKLGIIEIRKEANRSLPTEMEDAELERIANSYQKRKEAQENALNEKVWTNDDKRRNFLNPIGEKIDTLLADRSAFPDAETFEQLTNIGNGRLIKVLNKLQNEEVLSRVGKAILYLGEKGVLTDEILAEGATIQDTEDSLDAEARQLKLQETEDPDYSYQEEYYRRELAR